MPASDSPSEIPTVLRPKPKISLNYPVSPKENMRKVFDREKPLWVPNMMNEKALIVCPTDNDRPFFTISGKDWFGVDWTYVEAAGGQMVTPNAFLMEDPLEWEEKLIFPDLTSMDFSKGKEKAETEIDSSIMNFYLMQNGLFERLLSIAPPEEVLCFLAEEREIATRYFNRMAEYKIALMDKIIKEWDLFDVFINSDDWGTQISTFISPKMYHQYIFEPMKRIVAFAHDHGKYVNFHSCGKVETLVPQMIEINPDMWEAQSMNDLLGLRRKYGRQFPIQIKMDPDVVEKEGVSDSTIIAYVRYYVDTFALDGGLLANYQARDDHVHELICNELYEYSLNYYRNLSG